jgi:hypothetical protein
MSLRTDRARVRRWADQTADRARAAATGPDRAAVAEQVRRALEATERAAGEVEARHAALADPSC